METFWAWSVYNGMGRQVNRNGWYWAEPVWTGLWTLAETRKRRPGSVRIWDSLGLDLAGLAMARPCMVRPQGTMANMADTGMEQWCGRVGMETGCHGTNGQLSALMAQDW